MRKDRGPVLLRSLPEWDFDDLPSERLQKNFYDSVEPCSRDFDLLPHLPRRKKSLNWIQLATLLCCCSCIACTQI